MGPLGTPRSQALLGIFGGSRGRSGRSPGARFSKFPIINGPGKLSPFTLKIELSIVLHLT